MNNCTVCDECFDSLNKVICDGICRQSFHAECVNFSKDALLCYREMPNLQWFCDGCIFQTRSLNVSSPPFNKANSTIAVTTSSPCIVERSQIAVKRHRNSFPNAKSNRRLPVKLPDRSHGAEELIRNADHSMRSPSMNVKPKSRTVNRLTKFPVTNALNQLTTSVITQSDVDHLSPSANVKQVENCLVKTPTENGSIRLTEMSSLIAQSDVEVAQSRPQRYSVNDVVKDPTELMNLSVNSSSFTEVLNNSSTGQVQSQRTVSPNRETNKVVYVSNFETSVTEEQIVNYLIRKNVITSAEDVSCKILVSPSVDIQTVSFVSFKVTVGSKAFDSIVKSEWWPDGIVAREFVKR